jgi:hypothetical protein
LIQYFWNKPLTRVIVGIIAFIAAVAKILEFLIKPDIPSEAKLFIWIVLILTTLPLVVQVIVWGINRQIAYILYSKIYGMSYESLIVDCTIRHDGSAIFQRKIDLSANLPIQEMDHYMLLPEASLKGEALELVEITPPGPFRKLTPTVTALSSGRMALTVSIQPSMSPGDHIRYQVKEKSPPSLYAVTGLEERKVEYDYFAWDISRPTKRLEINIFFPEDVQPVDSELDVWYAVGQSRSRHDPEYKRVRDYLHGRQEGVHYTLGATVPYPVLGLSYVIKWSPPRPK